MYECMYVGWYVNECMLYINIYMYIYIGDIYLIAKTKVKIKGNIF